MMRNIVFGWIVLLPAVGSQAIDAAPIHGFVTIDVPSSEATIATDINDKSEIVGGYFGGRDRREHGYVLKHGVFTALDAFGNGKDTTPACINNHGDIVGDYLDTKDHLKKGFLFHNGKYAAISLLGDTWANSINNAGTIAGTIDYSHASRPTIAKMPHDEPSTVGYELRSVSGKSNIVYMKGTRGGGTFVSAINDRDDLVGSVVGNGSGIESWGTKDNFPSWASGVGLRGFMRHNGKFTILAGPAGALRVQANGINNADTVVGRYLATDHQSIGFILSHGRYKELSVPNAADTVPQAINNRGEVVGYYSDGKGLIHGFLWSP